MTTDASQHAGTPPAPPRGLLFRRRQRLSHNREYQAVYTAKMRKARGPIAVFGIPNGLPYSRLGLSVGRQVGGAVVRNRIKRLLREAFRLEQARAGTPQNEGIPAGLDLVVTVRPHTPAGLTKYRRTLVELSREIEREGRRRERRDREKSDNAKTSGAAAEGGDG